MGTGRLNRHDFGVSWNATLERGGVVVGDDVLLTLDAEAILSSDVDSGAGHSTH